MRIYDDDFLGESQDAHVGSPMQTQSSDVHVLIQPVNPLDIVQIATELRLMMLPELKTLFSEQLPAMQNMVKTAVKEANSELNKQAKQLDTEVKELRRKMNV